MALGSHPFGRGPLGFDPRTTTDGTVTPATSALLFDVSSKATLLDANGFARSVHPVDQEVALAIGVELGTLKSSPTVGLDYERLRSATRKTILAVAIDAVNVALAGPLGRGDIKILGVQAETNAGRISLIVEYVNLRTAKPMRTEGSR